MTGFLQELFCGGIDIFGHDLRYLNRTIRLLKSLLFYLLSYAILVDDLKCRSNAH